MYAQVQIHHSSLQRAHARLLCVRTDAPLSGLRDGGAATGCADTVHSKRLQVLNTWREIRQLEEEIKEKLVSAATTTATERCIKELKVLQDKLSTFPRIFFLLFRLGCINKNSFLNLIKSLFNFNFCC